VTEQILEWAKTQRPDIIWEMVVMNRERTDNHLRSPIRVAAPHPGLLLTGEEQMRVLGWAVLCEKAQGKKEAAASGH
jgi:hypothetical protein